MRYTIRPLVSDQHGQYNRGNDMINDMLFEDEPALIRANDAGNCPYTVEEIADILTEYCDYHHTQKSQFLGWDIVLQHDDEPEEYITIEAHDNPVGQL